MYISHSREWKNHKYISKKRGPGGKWIYKYKETIGLNARDNAKRMSKRSQDAVEGLANKGKSKLAKLVGYKRAGLRRVG